MADLPPILVLCRDLIFASKITGTAQALHRPTRLLRDPALLGTTPGQRLIVDLTLAGALDAATTWKTATGGAVIAFAPHVDAETIHAARAAGFEVLPRSEFSRRLPELLA